MSSRRLIMSSGVPPLLCEVPRWIMLHGTVVARSPSDPRYVKSACGNSFAAYVKSGLTRAR